MIARYGLFDPEMQPDQVNLSVSRINESQDRSRDDQQRKTQSKSKDRSKSEQMSRTQKSIQHSNMENSIEASKKGSLPSPRSTHSHFSKLAKQKEKIEELKQEAIQKL